MEALCNPVANWSQRQRCAGQVARTRAGLAELKRTGHGEVAALASNVPSTVFPGPPARGNLFPLLAWPDNHDESKSKLHAVSYSLGSLCAENSAAEEGGQAQQQQQHQLEAQAVAADGTATASQTESPPVMRYARPPSPS